MKQATHAMIMYETGGPRRPPMQVHDPAQPKWGEVRIVHQAVGLIFIDAYHPKTTGSSILLP